MTTAARLLGALAALAVLLVLLPLVLAVGLVSAARGELSALWGPAHPAGRYEE